MLLGIMLPARTLLGIAFLLPITSAANVRINGGGSSPAHVRYDDADGNELARMSASDGWLNVTCDAADSANFVTVRAANFVTDGGTDVAATLNDLTTQLAAAQSTISTLQSTISTLQAQSSSITSLQSSLDNTRNAMLACWSVLPPSVTSIPSGYRYATQIECTQYFRLMFGSSPASINRGDHAPRCYSGGYNAQGTTAYNAREGFSMYVYNSGC